MKSVLFSIKPKYCELIASGKKTVEVRKTRPKIDVPFKEYIYCTKGEHLWKTKTEIFLDGKYNRLIDDMPDWLLNGKVIGEFICDSIISHCEMANADIAEQQGCIKRKKLFEYSNGKELFGFHISDLVIYDKPKELNEFNLSRPPQSWCYVEELNN